jgi:hypothetical protein
MNVGFQAMTDHADGVADAILRIYTELVRQNVQNFSVIGKRNVASRINRAAYIFPLDITGTRTQCNAAPTVHSTHMIAGYADYRGLDGNIGDAFRFLHGTSNGADRGIKIYDQALAQTFRLSRAEA